MRLEQVHAELSQSVTGASIGGIARRYGFTHPGRFAVADRRRFGESPSETARRGARRSRPSCPPTATGARPLGRHVHAIAAARARKLVVFGDKGNLENCTKGSQRCWLFRCARAGQPDPDRRVPTPAEEDYCKRARKFGRHNLYDKPRLFPERAIDLSTYQNAGVRMFDIADPFAPREVAYFVPPAPEKMLDPVPIGRV
jgi:hypothetical protein